MSNAQSLPCRLDEALRQFRSSPSAKDVAFTVKFLPYQLYPNATEEGEDKYEWTKYDDSEDKMQKYITLMSTYGKEAGIDFDFHGPVANTLDAHRLIQHYQDETGAETANKIVDSLYAQYFTQQAHPSTSETLLKAAIDAGIDKTAAEAFVRDKYEGLPEVKRLIREQASDGVDSVPYIVIEGKRRDFTLVGAKEVGEYLKTLEGVVKEAGDSKLFQIRGLVGDSRCCYVRSLTSLSLAALGFFFPITALSLFDHLRKIEENHSSNKARAMARPRRDCSIPRYECRIRIRARAGNDPKTATWDHGESHLENSDSYKMRWLMLWRTTLLISKLLTFNASNSVNALALKLDGEIDTHPSRSPYNPTDDAKDVPSSLELLLYQRTIKSVNALGPGWVGHTIPSAAVYPLAIGAEILGKFYGIVAGYASGVWTTGAPSNFYIISWGTIKLYIWSEDSAVRIGWDFVHSVAVRMIVDTQRGFVGLFDASFVHVASGVMVHVKLTIKGKGGY
ncbi:MAG: hypothetical protein Q9166_003712 [cf. Caloplaca sp. 2 TL-2023]